MDGGSVGSKVNARGVLVLYDRASLDDDRLCWLSALCAGTLHECECLPPICDLTEYDMFTIEPLGRIESDEELAAIRVATRIRH